MIELPYTRKFSIDSYEIFVRVPNDYNDNTRDYPIIVLLDPNFLFTVLYGIKRVTDNNIIIGIGHKGLDFSHEKAQDLNYVMRHLHNMAKTVGVSSGKFIE